MHGRSNTFLKSVQCGKASWRLRGLQVERRSHNSDHLLNGATASEAAEGMEGFIAEIPTDRVLLITPPPFKRGAWVPDDRLISESMKMATEYKDLAMRCGTGYADAGRWDVALTFDGVHFTEEGHRAFATGLSAFISDSRDWLTTRGL